MQRVCTLHISTTVAHCSTLYYFNNVNRNIIFAVHNPHDNAIDEGVDGCLRAFSCYILGAAGNMY